MFLVLTGLLLFMDRKVEKFLVSRFALGYAGFALQACRLGVLEAGLLLVLCFGSRLASSLICLMWEAGF